MTALLAMQPSDLEKSIGSLKARYKAPRADRAWVWVLTPVVGSPHEKHIRQLMGVDLANHLRVETERGRQSVKVPALGPLEDARSAGGG